MSSFIQSPQLSYVTLSSNDVKSVNIDGSDDFYYRYKTPQLAIRHGGTGNKMTCTCFVNLEDVAKAIQIPTNYILAYIAYNLGVQFKTTTLAVSGKHSPETISTIVKEFIEIMLLCQKCHLPELVFTASTPKKNPKNKQLKTKCHSCGDYNVVRPTKKTTKFINYVFRNDISNNKKNTFRDCGMCPQSNAVNNGPPSLQKKEEINWETDLSDIAILKRKEELSPFVKGLIVEEKYD